MQISEPDSRPAFSILQLAFRPFFLAAGFFAVISVLVWMLLYLFGLSIPVMVAPAMWHAHEMVYGYTMAVVAGFLLTAVKNWTGKAVASGLSLLLLLLLWLAARVLAFGGPLVAMAVCDGLFMAGLLFAFFRPVYQARQWQQVGILSKVLLLLAFNIVFYLGALGVIEQGMRWGLYSGLYLLVALVLVMGRRVIPFFIERGVDGPVTIRNNKWLDIAGIVLFVAYWLLDLLLPQGPYIAMVAGILFVLHLVRLYWWHVAGIWTRPLLWVLWLAYGWIVVAFGLRVLSVYTAVPATLAVHAFAYGGIAMMTIGMMARVSLGHTGRNIHEGSRWLGLVFGFMFAGAFIRVVLPAVFPASYTTWILVAQLAWVLAFLLFLLIYLPVLLRPRVDGQPG